ncbi:MAG TPA: hypothetical protein VGE97_03175 [Nitrososphaera sp.]|jgi:hypothetical protein
MTLEEAEKLFTFGYRTAINVVGNDELIVKKLLPDTTEKPYIVIYAKEPSKSIGFNASMLGQFTTLAEVKNHFLALSFAADIDQNGWDLSPEKMQQ